jgi:hypothetical protein
VGRGSRKAVWRPGHGLGREVVAGDPLAGRTPCSKRPDAVVKVETMSMIVHVISSNFAAEAPTFSAAAVVSCGVSGGMGMDNLGRVRAVNTIASAE